MKCEPIKRKRMWPNRWNIQEFGLERLRKTGQSRCFGRDSNTTQPFRGNGKLEKIAALHPSTRKDRVKLACKRPPPQGTCFAVGEASVYLRYFQIKIYCTVPDRESEHDRMILLYRTETSHIYAVASFLHPFFLCFISPFDSFSLSVPQSFLKLFCPYFQDHCLRRCEAMQFN
jgi:hypothetical protein